MAGDITQVAELDGIPSAGRAEVRFDLLAIAGEEAGRAKFERLVTDVVKVIHPTARAIEANPGDWGIDTFVGELDTGDVGVWQSKFFLKPGDAKAHQSEIRDSYKSATKHADAEGIRLSSWTLAIPGTMDAPMTKWWDGWRKRQMGEREEGFEIQLWQATDLRSYLLKGDFAHVRAQYFGADPESASREILEPDDPDAYESALFIKQLRAADVRADSAARRAFFNAEVLTRDVNEREGTSELRELNGVRAVVEQLWETRFERARAFRDDQDDLGRLPGLYPEVCTAIEDHHQANPNRILRDTLVHRTGLVHHLAEAGKVGWVEHFARIAREHSEARP